MDETTLPFVEGQLAQTPWHGGAATAKWCGRIERFTPCSSRVGAVGNRLIPTGKLGAPVKRKPVQTILCFLTGNTILSNSKNNVTDKHPMSNDKLLYGNDIELALRAVGELLEADGQRIGIVLIGGAALNLLGVVERATRDVDIVAVTKTPGQPGQLARPPQPLPPVLVAAIKQVARDFSLPENWLNRGPAGQWDVGLPPGFADRVRWRTFGGLDVGVADRLDLICFKLEAAADQPDSNSRHFRDLVALNPSDEEMAIASNWAHDKNVGPEYAIIIDRAIEHVTSLRRKNSP